MRATEQLSMVPGQRSGPLAGSEERVSDDDTGSMNIDGKHERRWKARAGSAQEVAVGGGHADEILTFVLDSDAYCC